MNIRIIEKTDISMRLIIEGVDVPFINSLRRVMLAEVPSMAIVDVVIIENSSLLHDEILAHRLGLIPLKTDLITYNLPNECDCKSEFGCNRCRTTLTLEVEADEKGRTVYSSELNPDDPNIIPVSDKILIVKLAPGQKIQLEAYAQLGKGKDHVKWQPVSACAYRYLPQVIVDNTRCNVCNECVKICPKKILIQIEEKIEARTVLDCTLCQDCVDVCSLNPPSIQVTWDEHSFVLYIESNDGLSVEKILLEALRIMNSKFSDFLTQLNENTNLLISE